MCSLLSFLKTLCRHQLPKELLWLRHLNYEQHKEQWRPNSQHSMHSRIVRRNPY